MPMPSVLRALQYSGFVVTEIANLLLLVLIFTRASSKIGSYKYLMITFTVFSLTYAIVEILTQPVMHITGTGLIVYVDSFLRYEKTIGFHLTALYCSSFGLCVLLLSTHFCYRYLAVCRPHVLRILSGIRLALLFFPALFLGIIWFLTVEICERPSEFNSKFLKESLKFYYDEDSYRVAQLSAVYYYYDSSGAVQINWLQCMSILILNLIMGASITTILIFGVKTYKSVKSQTKMSQRTKDLHQQLFYTLVLQSVIPFFTLFLPVGLLLLLPFANVNIGHWSNAPGAYISFYPAIDAAVAMLMIRDFRNALLCKQRTATVKFTATVDSDVISENPYTVPTN